MDKPTRGARGYLNEAVAGEIRAELARRQWSQVELASKLGEDQMWLSRRLRATKPLTLTEFEAIARVLEIAPSELLARAIKAAAPTTLAKTPPPDRPRDNRPKGGPDQHRKNQGVVPRRTRPLGAATGEPLSRTAE